jgi:hypothetical protein
MRGTDPTAFTPDVAATGPFVITLDPNVAGAGSDAVYANTDRRRRGYADKDFRIGSSDEQRSG